MLRQTNPLDLDEVTRSPDPQGPPLGPQEPELDDLGPGSASGVGGAGRKVALDRYRDLTWSVNGDLVLSRLARQRKLGVLGRLLPEHCAPAAPDNVLVTERSREPEPRKLTYRN